MHTPKNGQTHVNNSSAKADEWFEYVGHYGGLALRRLMCSKSSKCHPCRFDAAIVNF